MSERDDLRAGEALPGESPPDPLPEPPSPPQPPVPVAAQPPALPPWLRSQDTGLPPPGSPGRVDATHPAPAAPAPEPFLPSPPTPTAAGPLLPPPPTTTAAGNEQAVATAASNEQAGATAAGNEPSVATPPRPFGAAMATGVLLTLAGGSVAAGGILGLWQAEQPGFAVKALISGAVAVVLLVGAVLMRLVRGSEDLRGLLAVVGIAFAAASLTFAYDPADAGDHDNLVKFALVAGVVAVLGWFCSVVVPSAVAGLLAAVALPAAAGAGVWLGVDAPTWVEAYVAALGTGLALAAVLPRVTALRPHATGLGWTLAGAALAVAVPAVALMTRGDAVALAAGATASAALLALAARHRHLPAALGALAGFATLESVLISSFLVQSGGGDGQASRLVAVAIAGAALLVLVAAAVLLDARGRLPRPSARLAASIADVLLVAALALAVVSIFTGPGEVPVKPTQYITVGSTATHAPPAARS